MVKKDKIDFNNWEGKSNAKAWRDIWSAGHGVGAIDKIESAADIISSLETEYQEALEKVNQTSAKLRRIQVK